MKKYRIFLVLLLLMPSWLAAYAQEYQRGDVDQDGQVNIGDVTCLIDYLLNGSWPEEPVTPPDNHEWVDLGLPSGTLWATCNVGANSPEEYGDHFAWGETEPKDVYSWETYKWCYGTSDSMMKYCTNSSYGFIDDKTELEPEDDAATVNWGEKWRTPTNEQIKELINKCTWTWTTLNGVNGYLIVGPNDNTLFLPAAGDCHNEWLYATGTEGYYWSRTIVTNFPNQAYFIDFYSGGERYDAIFRYFGISVRPVRVPQD